MSVRYSVIIPVYNAEKTICRCVDSLLIQNYDNAEIILVNDGSKDNSGAICEQYCSEYQQVKYINKENGGVSTARNAGISEASGDYILFVDSDDYVADNYFAAIDKVLSENNGDLIIFSHYSVNEEVVSQTIYNDFYSKEKDVVFDKLSRLICCKIINAPWGKVYKREIVNNNCINFTCGVSIAEDKAFNVKYALCINSLQIVSIPLYYVNIDNPNSLSRKKKDNLEEQFKLVAQDIDKSISKSNISSKHKHVIAEALNFGECRRVYSIAKNMHIDNLKWNVRIKEIRQICKEINKHKYVYPKTRYCNLITWPVKLKLSIVIDALAWKMTR